MHTFLFLFVHVLTDILLVTSGINIIIAKFRGKFIERHETTIVLEINRDGQLYGILRKEIPINLVPKLRSVAYSDGMPPRGKIYADLILEMLQDVEK